MFGELDFIYFPSRDVAADLFHFTDRLGGRMNFAIERFGTRVAMVTLADHGPAVLLAEHLAGDQPILLFRVTELASAIDELVGRGVVVGERFGFPHGEGVELDDPGPQRIADLPAHRPEVGHVLEGRRDFSPRQPAS